MIRATVRENNTKGVNEGKSISHKFYFLLYLEKIEKSFGFRCWVLEQTHAKALSSFIGMTKLKIIKVQD